MNFVDAAAGDIAGFSAIGAAVGVAAGGGAVCAMAKPVESAVAASAAAKIFVRITTSIDSRRAALGGEREAWHSVHEIFWEPPILRRAPSPTARAAVAKSPAIGSPRGNVTE